ncbi:MAG: branched-chain amino acid ABC transporter permease [Candidatus Saccharimonas sp.]|nr:branched-chain amino acid ABC transporter permease [Planctomycetaceae bacterium]
MKSPWLPPLKLLIPELVGLFVLLLFPALPLGWRAWHLPEVILFVPVQEVLDRVASQLPIIFILTILALGLNVVVGYTGLLHLGMGAFFGIGAYLTGILTIPGYPFECGFWLALVMSTFGAALAGVMLAAPTLRLRGDYLALVTLGFGEVVRFSLRNLEEITAGTRALNPIPPPNLTWLGLTPGSWSDDMRPFYYLCLVMLAGIVWLLRNLERSRLGRAWVAIREDELAATCMGINAARAKLAAFAVGSALAGLAGSLYATKLTTTAGPDAYDFNRSIIVLACVILGGLGSIRGVIVGSFLLVGFDNVFAPMLDGVIQKAQINPTGNRFLMFTNWRLIIFGLALVLMMRYRPEGLLPSKRESHGEAV